MLKPALAAASIALSCAPASAQPVEKFIDKFVNAPGFASESPNGLETGNLAHWLEHDDLFGAADAGPIEKAVLIATSAISSTRTRTAISFGQMLTEDDDNGAPYPVSFIEIRHYNLGPRIREEVIADYGLENTADAEEFGLGEHRAWRFAFMPIMNATAVIVEASSREISDEEAASSDCTGTPCLSLYASLDEVAPWEPWKATPPDWPRLFAESDGDIATPAHTISELAVLGFWANVESGHYQWTGGEHPEGARETEPFRFIGIDRNLGQELSIDTVWHETRLNDDAITDLFFRRLDIAGGVQYMRATLGR